MYVSVLCSRSLLFLRSTCNSLQLLIPHAQCILPPSLLPLGDHKAVLYVCESVSVPQISSFVDHILFNHASVIGHLVHFYFLAM